MFKYLVLLLIMIQCTNGLTKYGKYCGKDHYDSFGGEAVDVFDRSCQIHDICCTSQGLLSCYCNEQLYWLISNLEPKTVNQTDIKDFILKTIYVSVITCKNYYLFDEYYYVTKVYNDQYNRGFNYLPLRMNDPDINMLRICAYETDLYIYDISNENYSNFTSTAYYNPIGVYSYKHDVVVAQSCKYIHKVTDWKVIYNPTVYDTMFQLIRNNRFKPLALRV